MKKYAMRAFALALVWGTGVAFSSCKDEEKVNPDVEIVETELGTYVSGVVTDGSTALSGVTVTAGDASATTDASGAYMLPVSAGAVTVTASGDGYVPVSRSVTVAETAVTTLDFELANRNASQTLTPESDLAMEESIDKITTMTFPAGAVTENTEIAITEYRAETEADNVGAISVVYCEPDGQEFLEPVRVEIDKTTSPEVAFADMKHYVQNEQGNWVEEGDVTVEDNLYVTSLRHFSNHAFGAAATWSGRTESSEEDDVIEIDNIGNVSAITSEVSVSARSGWEVDGDLSSIVSAALSGVSASDAEALASDLNRMLRNAKGTTSNVGTHNVSLGSVQVSGDTRATISVQQRFASSSMQVDVLFRGNRVAVTIPVREYLGASMTVSYTYGDLRPDHSGGSIGG